MTKITRHLSKRIIFALNSTKQAIRAETIKLILGYIININKTFGALKVTAPLIMRVAMHIASMCCHKLIFPQT